MVRGPSQDHRSDCESRRPAGLASVRGHRALGLASLTKGLFISPPYCPAGTEPVEAMAMDFLEASAFRDRKA